MKAFRILAVVLVCVMLSCLFVACDEADLSQIVLPERDFYDMTVSFQVANDKGEIIIDAKDYNYKGHETPTILNILSDYLAIEVNMKCVIQDNTLVQIGTSSFCKASIDKGDYWAFANGIGHNVGALIEDDKLQNKTFVNDQRMSDYIVEDGGAFTIVLIRG